MRLTLTYWDNLTLKALAREFNCQFLIMNAQGDGYHRIVLNTYNFESDMPLLTLGYYPEYQGEHYVSVEVELQFLTSTVQSINSGNDNGFEEDVSDQGRENKQARQVELVSNQKKC